MGLDHHYSLWYSCELRKPESDVIGRAPTRRWTGAADIQKMF
jgi:hypothetical protein